MGSASLHSLTGLFVLRGAENTVRIQERHMQYFAWRRQDGAAGDQQRKIRGAVLRGLPANLWPA